MAMPCACSSAAGVRVRIGEREMELEFATRWAGRHVGQAHAFGNTALSVRAISGASARTPASKSDAT
jgi:hypothetical protein